MQGIWLQSHGWLLKSHMPRSEAKKLTNQKCLIKFKNDVSELIYKTEIDSDLENKLMVTKANGG